MWVWKSFLDQKTKVNVTVGVWSYKRDSLVGQRTVFNTNAQEFWSNAAKTADECTSGEGTINLPPSPRRSARAPHSADEAGPSGPRVCL
ncbi:hypothetical protein SCALM49S_09165 [Streptomyces californicus]